MEDEKKSSNGSNGGSNTDPNGEIVNTGRWTDAEHRRFLDGLAQYG
jgi:hypothetical protein